MASQSDSSAGINTEFCSLYEAISAAVGRILSIIVQNAGDRLIFWSQL